MPGRKRKKKAPREMSPYARLNARVRKAKALLQHADLSFVGDTNRHRNLVECIEFVGAALGMKRFDYVKEIELAWVLANGQSGKGDRG